MKHYLDEFLEMLAAERQAAVNTIESYKRDLTGFFTFIKDLNNLENITSDHLQKFIHHLHTQSFQPTSIARKISALRQFFHFLISMSYLPHDPSEHIQSPRKNRPLPKILSVEEVSHLIKIAFEDKTAEGVRLYTILELLYSTGMRVSELVSLPLKSLPYNRKTHTFGKGMYIKGKGGKERLVPLSQMAQESLFTYLNIREAFLKHKDEDSPWLFPSSSAQGYLTRQRLGQLLKELACKMGLNPAKLSPHVIRHAFATHLLQNGANLLTIQKLLGHADIGTTQIYTHLSTDHLVSLIDHHHPLSQKKL